MGKVKEGEMSGDDRGINILRKSYLTNSHVYCSLSQSEKLVSSQFFSLFQTTYSN